MLVVSVALAAVAAVGWHMRYPVLELLTVGNECATSPDEPAILGTEQVFLRLPRTASPAADPASWQPCDQGESDYSGGRSVRYQSVLGGDEITRHYQGVARDSGWRLVPDKSVDHSRLVFAMKWARDRCLWLSVVRDAQELEGVYTVAIIFWKKYTLSFCND
jgi:hypothetical protein